MNEEITLADPQERFQDFLKSAKYRKRISQMAINESKSLVIDFDDLLSADSELARIILEKPDEYLEHANKAAYEQLKMEEPEYAEQLEDEKVIVRLRGLPETTKLRILGSAQIGKLVMVEGIIVRATPVRPIVTMAVFKCKRCGTHNAITQSGPFLRAPFQCSDPACS
ncbi:MAG: Minichromosome maintenance protein MCM, partial [Candidatus Bathyarchaeia archaeon]